MVLRTASRRNETKNKTVLRTSSENRHAKTRRWWLSTNAHNWLRFPARQHLGTRPSTRGLLASLSSSQEQDRETNGLINGLGTRTPSAAHQTIESAAESEIGPTQVLLRLGGRREVVARSVQTHEFALSTDAQMTMRLFDQGPLEINRSGQLFLVLLGLPWVKIHG